MIEIQSDIIDNHLEFWVLHLLVYDGESRFEIDTTREETREFIDEIPYLFRCNTSEQYGL